MIKMLRLPAVVERRGDSRSGVYRDIESGTWTPPVRIGERASAWPEHECDAILRARIAGNTDDDIRALVSHLVAQRKAAQ
jgi:prophage regulatory protein